MKYLMIINTPRDGFAQLSKWPRKIIEAHMAYMSEFNRRIMATGEFVEAHGMTDSDRALRVRKGKDGKPVTDGVFAESKEYLAGFWIIDVESRERAIELAAEASNCPIGPTVWPDGRNENEFWIELREVMSAPPTFE